MDRLDAMRLFVRSAELGSFAAAADQMNVARSAVTRQIAALEAHLGVKLMARSTRRLALTTAGAAYLEKCRVILNLVDTAEAAVSAERQAPRGPIRLSIPASYGLLRLTPLLLEFAQRYPEVSLEMDYSDRRAKLIEDGIDLAIRVTHRVAPTDIARPIATEALVVLASPGYLARHGEPAHPGELIHHECLGYTGTAGASWQFRVNGKPENFPVSSRICANNGEALVQAAAQGLGIARQPRFIAAAFVARGQVREILTGYPPPELGVYALLPGNKHVPHRVRALVHWLAERLKNP